MFPKLILISSISIVLVGCDIVAKKQEETQQASSLDAIGLVESSKSKVKIKRAHQLKRSLSKILGLNANALCLELGKIPCADIAHKASLGGMEAYTNSQYELPKEEAITAPMAVDRLILASCSTRASLDIVNPAQGVIFKNIDLTDDGRITKNDAFYNSIKELYQRAYLRNPHDYEMLAMENLYVDIYNKNPIGAARNWAVLSCYTVLSGLEFLFY